MLNMELLGEGKSGWPQKRFMDIATEHTQKVGVKEDDARDTLRWRHMICCGDL